MEKSTKKEYIAVPTSDVEEAALPPYEETNPADKSQKRKTVRFLLIGGAIALLGLTHLCTSNYMSKDSIFKGDALAEYQDREPCALKHLEQYNELKGHMSDIMASFGEPQHPGRRPDLDHLNGPQDGPPKHHGHHKEHKHKHHKGKKHHDEPAPPPPSDDVNSHNNEAPPPPLHGGHGKHHHKDHKHKHHKGKKPHDEPAPPPPPGALAQNEWTNDNPTPVVANEAEIEGDKKKKHPHKPFCDIKKLEATSTAFNFSPEEFQRAGVFLSGYFSRGGHVRLSKSSDESVTDVKVNVTLYTGREDLKEEVKLSAFDHEGQYAVQIERGHFKGTLPPSGEPPHDGPPHDGPPHDGPPHGGPPHGGPPHGGPPHGGPPHGGPPHDGPPHGGPPHDGPPHDGPPHDGPPHDGPPHDGPPHDGPEGENVKGHKGRKGDDKKEHNQENCLVYNVDIEFPSNVDYFEELQLHIKSAQRIEGGAGLDGIEFGTVKAGLGHGAIIFDGLKAKKLLLGVVNGVVMGTYQPSETFAAGVIRGAAKVNIEPTGENVNITATSTFGPASVDIPADSFKGYFTLFNLFGETSSITAPNPEDIHVTKFKPTTKSGYYKEENPASHIVVSAKLHGGEYISFN